MWSGPLIWWRFSRACLLENLWEICGDTYASCDIKQCPLLKTNEFFVLLNVGAWFSMLDLKDAYQQIPLKAEPRNLEVIKYHPPSTAVTDCHMTTLQLRQCLSAGRRPYLMNTPRAHVSLCDRLVSEHDSKFWSAPHNALQRLQASSVRLQEEKCKLGKTEGT